MISFPPCKINLGLYVIEKRPDGYHNLETCFYPVPWTDILEIIPSEKFSFTISGMDVPGDPEDNLCVKAYRLLSKDFGISPVSIHLHKLVPTGAGLGGGSSDAAYTLRVVNNLFSLKLSTVVLTDYASRLGSDCSFFIHDGPMLATARGEVLEGISDSLRGKFLVIIKPTVSVSTAEAYAGMQPRKPEISIREILGGQTFHKWKYILRNDFEDSVFKKYPVIGQIKNKLYDQGAVYASMSGSGSAVFGLFDTEVNLKKEFEGSLYWNGPLSTVDGPL